ncbi:MAG: QueT transporter family protein [Armatimonadetes bacterium]|nr:QueT transporter family protein [Armatimonadota bacterium]
MRDLLAVWGNTRLVVQVAVTAALYAAVLIPFKAIAVIIPGVTEVRPANAIPIVFSLLFGPAAAWGSAFGNPIGDMLGGTLTTGSPFGFVGNFLYGYIPYRAWGAHRLARREAGQSPLSGRGVVEYVLVGGLASVVCGVFVGWGAELVGLAPFKVLGPTISLNNFLMAAVLGPPLLAALYPRVRKWGLLYWQVLHGEQRWPSLVGTMGVIFCWVGSGAALVTGLGVAAEGAAGMAVVKAVAIPLAVVLAGVCML